MALRLVNKTRTYPITVCGTRFAIISMSIGEKAQLCDDLVNIGGGSDAFNRLLDVIAPAITSIEGYDAPVVETLGQLEDIRQLTEIVQAVIRHCDLTNAEAKNSPSSSAQPIPVPAGSAEKLVESDDVPVSTIPTRTDT